MTKQALLGVSGLITSALVLVSGPVAAQTCLNDSLDKVCLQMTAQPDKFVQASRLDGETDTFVYYTAKVSGLTNPTSSRYVTAAFTLTPAVEIVDFSSTTPGVCTGSGATLSCIMDKHGTLGADEIVTITAKAPLYDGANTPSTLTNTAVFGWNGRTQTTSKSLTVTTAGGYTWVPPFTTVALVTSPETANPDDQTTAANPRFAKMVIPGRDVGFLAYLALNNNTDEDFSQSCSAGLFYTGTSDGGPYVCRDIGAPYDAGIGTRWVEAAIEDTVDGTFTDAPVTIYLNWDASVVSPLQVDPAVPPFAVFYHAQEPAGSAVTNPIRAFSSSCDSEAPPCLSGVARLGSGDWVATLELSRVYDDSVADPILPPLVLGAFYGILNQLLGTADAGVLPPPVILN